MPSKQANNVKPFAFFFNYEGIDQEKSPFIIQPSAAEELINMHRGSIGSFTAYNQGYSALTAAMESGTKVDSLIGYTNISGTKYLLAACNGKLKNIDMVTGALGSDVTTALTAGNQVCGVTFKGSLYLAEPGITPLRWTGTGTASAVSGIPLTNGVEIYDKPTMAIVYANRLVYANFQGGTSGGTPTTFPSHIAISNDLAPDTFTLTPTSTDTNGAVAQVAPGDGEVITAMRVLDVPLLGQTYLAIWKERSFYVLTGTTPTTFKLRIVNANFGCLNNNCVVQVGNDFIFADEDGIYSFTTASQSGTLQPKVIGSRKIKNTFAQINVSAKDKAWAVYMKDRNEVWFGIPTGSSTDVDTIIVYALPNTDEEEHLWIVRNGFPSAPRCGLVFNRKFWTGDKAGYVHQWFNSSNYNGQGFNYSYKYPYFNYGSQFQNKELTSLNAWLMLVGPESITFRQQWRGGGNNNIRSISRTVTTNGGSSVYGTVRPPAAQYGTDYYGAGANLVMVQLPPMGNGLQQQLTFSGTTGTTAPVFLGFSGLARFGKYSTDYR